MIVYRICKQQYAEDLSGRGAQTTGGRWNSKGTALLYASSSRALCALEVLVHLPAGIIPKNYALVTIEMTFNYGSILALSADGLPDGWNANPFKKATQRIGDQFVKRQKSLILKVPSATIPDEWNYLLNPQHPDFKKVAIKAINPFYFDERLFTK